MVIALGCCFCYDMIAEKREFFFAVYLQVGCGRLELVVHSALQCSGISSEAGCV